MDSYGAPGIWVSNTERNQTGLHITKAWVGPYQFLAPIQYALDVRRIRYKTFYDSMPQKIEAYFDYPANHDGLGLENDQHFEAALTTAYGLLPSNGQRDLWELPRVVAAIRSLGLGIQSLISFKAAVQASLSGQTGVNSDLLQAVITTPTANPAYQELYGLIMRLSRGRNSWDDYRYSFKRQQTFSVTKQVYTFDFPSVGKISSSAQISAAFPDAPFTIPAGIWMQAGAPEMNQMNNAQFEVEQIFAQVEFDNWIYSRADGLDDANAWRDLTPV